MDIYRQYTAVLVLEDGNVFYGYAIGAPGSSVGEVVFNTAMTGYQEILTDPSYCRQMVCLTYPHIGNTGINLEDFESDKVYASALIIRDLPLLASNWRCQTDLSDFLKQQQITAIAGIDTRRLTRLLRQKGALNGCILTAETISADDKEVIDQALEQARAFPGLKGMDLAKVVSRKQVETWQEGTWQLGSGYQKSPQKPGWHVVAYDFGVKRNILRLLAQRGCRLTIVPAQTPAAQVLDLKPDGVFLSNGPGDPEPCRYAIDAIGEILARDIPVFGICLGHQLLSLASGARSLKMKFGHHGANHPVQALDSGQVMITSQNHGFAIDENSLPPNLQVTHKSLFDQSIQGVRRTDKPAFGFQGHPEASPGPHDIQPLFDQFIDLMRQHQAH